jgi:hypothetical protein
MTRICCLALLALLGGLFALGSALAQPGKPNLETISYADLGKLVRANKGKVVLVYFWAHF